jgi:hypothetical protein
MRWTGYVAKIQKCHNFGEKISCKTSSWKTKANRIGPGSCPTVGFGNSGADPSTIVMLSLRVC